MYTEYPNMATTRVHFTVNRLIRYAGRNIELTTREAYKVDKE